MRDMTNDETRDEVNRIIEEHNAALRSMDDEQKRVVERAAAAMMLSLSVSIAEADRKGMKTVDPTFEPMVALGILIVGEAMGITGTEIANKALADLDGFMEMVKGLDMTLVAGINKLRN